MSRRQSGFTLVETLVALAIVGLSFAFVFKVISDNLDRTRRTRDDAVAASLAQSLLAQAAAGTPRPGISSGRLAGGFAWRIAVAPYANPAARRDWTVDAVTIAATVSWRDDGAPRSRTLSTLRVVPRAPAE